MRNKILVGFLASLLLFVVGYVFTNSATFNLCDTSNATFDANCVNSNESIGDPLFYGMGALAIVFLMLAFKTDAVGSWKKFAKWYIPLATLVFVFYGGPSSGDFFSPYPEQVYQWLAGAYILVSGFLILRSRK